MKPNALSHFRALIAGAATATLFAAPALAHHGWSWTTGENMDVTGTVTEASLGNPHGELKLDVDGEIWTIEVGQPWRNDRAGLTDEDYAPGSELRIVGEPSSQEGERLLKAERVFIDGKEHALYPDRD
ncbi:DUF6152 family protein [Henriciella aquimarina]|uniref:DUF6152 family protein n=1 Tax=Henriciella aquimarina TaxID=545261 RepID=UPI0009FE0904|nr:DUF6152 family protein [Henriciella aquimarina]